tara:strand:+ start:782 stop:1606 length:825 start_codon:yes stop_codon:yes gene_type:complete
MKNNTFKQSIITLVSLWSLLFFATPLLLMLALSFFTPSEHGVYSFPLTLNNYQVLTEPYFYRILSRSLMVAALASFFCFVIAYPFSYFLSTLKNKTFVLLLILIPFWTSSLIRTYALIGLFKTHGILNELLLKIHLIQKPLDMMFNQTAVIIGLTYHLLPFMILPLYNVFNKFDRSLILAAKDLNATNTFLFKTIIWPMSLPGVKNALLMIFFPAMTTFYIPTILGGAKSILLGNLIENQFLLMNDWPGGATTSVIVAIILFVSMHLFTKKEGT